ncbi:DEAD/DEAH box helicase [Clostridium sp.]|uniref:DEAD/DEAH box helicase n=1 Tax=Clostridium sp. TaxID=1506 RepID=UPI00399620EA
MNEKYFELSTPNIIGNNKLRSPQIESYIKIKEYFEGDYKNRNALVVLPTGVGKTGVMAIAPFKICKKRTLIITPGTTIKDNVIEELSSNNVQNFWLKCDVFKSPNMLPHISEYIGNKIPLEILEKSNIVIVNIHKLQERLDSSLLKMVDKDFFDFIIIDEAHHSVAQTWKNTVEYFKNAKVLKLTGTPFRTDGEVIEANLIYKYSLSRAMAKEYIKSLSNIVYVPDELKLTIDNKEKEYTVEEIFKLGLKDQEWISRSVAYSKECSEKVVIESINLLNKKLLGSKIPHKIIAIACSIKHAADLQELYEKHNMRVVVIHSKLDSIEKSNAFSDIENNRVDVVINIAMLGEGYDHPYLSIAAIFRPFRNELPYIQFIGRVLRKIYNGTDKDNIAHVISHKNLYLNDLWQKYKKEIDESDIIRVLIDESEVLSEEIGDIKERKIESKGLDVGTVRESNNYSIVKDDYLDTELLKRNEVAERKLKEQIDLLLKAMPNLTKEQAKLMIQQNSSTNNTILNRPDLIYMRTRKNIDVEIREKIVPELSLKYDLDNKENFEKCGLFNGPYWYLPTKIGMQKKRNTALLAMFFNASLKNKIGRPRKEWVSSDYDNAFLYLESLKKYIDKTLNQYYN